MMHEHMMIWRLITQGMLWNVIHTSDALKWKLVVWKRNWLFLKTLG